MYVIMSDLYTVIWIWIIFSFFVAKFHKYFSFSINAIFIIMEIVFYD